MVCATLYYLKWTFFIRQVPGGNPPIPYPPNLQFHVSVEDPSCIRGPHVRRRRCLKPLASGSTTYGICSTQAPLARFAQARPLGNDGWNPGPESEGLVVVLRYHHEGARRNDPIDYGRKVN